MQNWLGEHSGVVACLEVIALLVLFVVTTGIAKSAFARRQEQAESRRRQNAGSAVEAYRAASIVLHDTVRMGRVNPLWVYRERAVSRLRTCIAMLERVDPGLLDHGDIIRHDMILQRCDACVELLTSEAISSKQMAETEVLAHMESLLEGIDDITAEPVSGGAEKAVNPAG